MLGSISNLLFPSGDPSLIDGEFLDKFDIVVLSRASLKTKVAYSSLEIVILLFMVSLQ
jgi:hypothetical protein